MDNRIHNFSVREFVCEGMCNALTEECDIAIDSMMDLSKKLQNHQDLLKEN